MRFYISRCLSHCGISKVTEFGRQLIYLLLLMTINANHKDVVVKFNILKGSAVRLNADEITVVGTEQNIAGGNMSTVTHKDLVQRENTMSATDGGQILNVSEEDLVQEKNTMAASKGGMIKNYKSRKKEFIVLTILTVSSSILGILSWLGVMPQIFI